jgi:hypothetical protein
VTPRRLAALGILLAGALHAGGAQGVPELRLEAGRAQIRQRGYDVANAALLGLYLRLPQDGWTVLLSSNFTYARDSLAAAQGVAAFAIPWSVSERLRTEFGFAGASFSLRTVGRGGNGNLFVRQHIVDETRGAWLGAGLGATERDAVGSTSSAVDIGVWQRLGAVYFGGSLARHSSGDWPLLLSSGVVRNPDDETYQLLDAQATVSARNGPHEFTLAYTTRRGFGGTETQVHALSANGVLQLTERVALLGVLGRQLADPLRGLPQASLFALSGRVSFGAKPLPVMQRSLIAAAEVRPIIGGGGELTVRVFATDTMVIEIAGDFSEWEPVPLEREGPYFVARVRLPPGKYRVAVRINLGVWRAPRNLARVRDDYGGEAGLIVIP